MVEAIVTFALGVVAGVLGNFTFEWSRQVLARATGRIELKGVWGEQIFTGSERRYSIGQMRFDLRQRMWVFDGTNYHNNGTPFCHWRTIASYVDCRDHRFYYIFANTHVESTQAGYTGFGFIDLDYRDRCWVPRNGAFAAGNPGEAFRSHSMVSLNQWPKEADGVLSAFTRISDG